MKNFTVTKPNPAVDPRITAVLDMPVNGVAIVSDDEYVYEVILKTGQAGWRSTQDDRTGYMSPNQVEDHVLDSVVNRDLDVVIVTPDRGGR